MTTQTSRTNAKGLGLAAAALCALALAGCENPQPTAAPEQPTAAPPAPDAALMGAPEGPPTTRTPQYVGPSGAGYPPPPGYTPSPPAYGPSPGYGPPAYAQGDVQTRYPPGYGHVTGPGAPGEILAMRPIPNPPEQGEYYGRWYGPHPHHHHRLWMYGGEARRPVPAPLHHHRHHHRLYAVAPGATHAQPMRPHPVAPSGARPTHRAAPAPVAPVGQLHKPHVPSHRHAAAASTAAAATGGPTNTTAETSNTTGSEADRYKGLEAALHDAFESAAVLNVPSNMPAGQAATVTLTLPAEFTAAVQRDAAQQGLSADVANMNLLATLSGDGYAITPTEPQTVALNANQPMTFQWQVTPAAGAHGPLKANVRAQAVSAGQYLNLGDKTAGDTMLAGKIVGIGLLVLIAALILGWAMRRGAKPRQTVVRRPAYDQYTPPPGSRP